jgi:hypothetical protein
MACDIIAKPQSGAEADGAFFMCMDTDVTNGSPQTITDFTSMKNTARTSAWVPVAMKVNPNDFKTMSKRKYNTTQVDVTQTDDPKTYYDGAIFFGAMGMATGKVFEIYARVTVKLYDPVAPGLNLNSAFGKNQLNPYIGSSVLTGADAMSPTNIFGTAPVLVQNGNVDAAPVFGVNPTAFTSAISFGPGAWFVSQFLAGSSIGPAPSYTISGAGTVQLLNYIGDSVHSVAVAEYAIVSTGRAVFVQNWASSTASVTASLLRMTPYPQNNAA